jgi:uncharacterized protein (TIGR00369 family)
MKSHSRYIAGHRGVPMKVNPSYVEALKRVVKKSPYPSHMAMVLDHIEIDGAEVGLNLDRCHLQPYGIVHGGVVATVIDTATFWSAFLRLPEDAGLVNVDLKLNYLQPVVDGRLIGRGTCMRHGRSICYSEAKVFDQNENLIAHGTSTLMVLPGKGLKLGVKKFLDDQGG